MNQPSFGGSDLVSVPRESYLRMCRDSNELMSLRACGVHNWEGHGDAMRLSQGPSGGTE